MRQHLRCHALSHTQLAMMQHYFAEPESYCNFEFQHLFLRGQVDTGRLNAAWRAVFQRHPILNSVIRWGRDSGGPRQIYRPGPPPVRQIEQTGPAGRKALIAQRRAYRVDLRRGCFELLLLPGPDGVDMLMNTHHIVYDGWSCSVMLDRLRKEYGSQRPPSLPPAPEYTFEAFQAWQSRLDPAPLPSSLPADAAGIPPPAGQPAKGAGGLFLQKLA